MRRPILAILAAILASLACSQVVTTPTPAPSLVPTTTPTIIPTATLSPAPLIPVGNTAIVVKPVVLIHKSAGSDELSDKWLEEGDEVEIIQIDGDWVQIKDPPGWVWIGCLEGLSNKGCRAAQ